MLLLDHEIVPEESKPAVGSTWAALCNSAELSEHLWGKIIFFSWELDCLQNISSRWKQLQMCWTTVLLLVSRTLLTWMEEPLAFCHQNTPGGSVYLFRLLLGYCKQTLNVSWWTDSQPSLVKGRVVPEPWYICKRTKDLEEGWSSLTSSKLHLIKESKQGPGGPVLCLEQTKL